MRGALFLAWRHLAHERRAAALLAGALALVLLLPLATRLLTAGLAERLERRAAATPLVAGAPGSRFDLVLTALHFRRPRLAPVPASLARELAESGEALAVPLHARFTARGHPLVGTAVEYFEQRGLAPRAGTLPLLLGDCVLGADVARELGLAPGATLFSDQPELYDLSRPPAIELAVVGVLGRAGTPDDGAVFVDVRTAWLLEGLYHAHAEGGEVPPEFVLGEAEGVATLSEAVVPRQAVRAEELGRYHLHADPDTLPLTCVLLFPRSAKDGTLLRARVDAAGRWQVLAPLEVARELLGVVLRVRRLVDGVTAVLGAATLALGILVALLSARLRAGEMRTVDRLGGGRATVARLYLAELALVLLASVALAGLLLGALSLAFPDPTRLL